MIRVEQLDLWSECCKDFKFVLHSSGWRCRKCEHKSLAQQGCNDLKFGRKRNECEKKHMMWTFEICAAHYLVENKIPWYPQTYPLQCRNTDASHHAPCKTNPKNLVLVFIMLYKMKITFYNCWLPSAICRRFSFPCNMLWDSPADGWKKPIYVIQ
jgi:hypothetical protein